MTPKQRIWNALRGKPVDRILYCPFLANWWEKHQQSVHYMDRFDLMESTGADPLIRGGIRPFFYQHQQVQRIVLHDTPIRKCYRYHTPIGDLQYTFTFSPGPNTWFLTERPVKELRDLEIVRYIFDDLSVIPDPELFEIRAGVIGQRGLLVPETGVIRPQSSFQSLLDFWVGTVELSYMLGDAPGKVESTLEIMHERNWEAIIATSQTSAEAVITFEETSSTSITPQIYQEYIQPELKAWANLLHQKGKLLIHHAGGPIEDLLPKIAHSGIDVLESVSFRPYSGISMPQMRHALPSSITLMGGLDAATVGRMSETELEQYTKQLLMEMPKAGFILSSEVTGPPEAACSKQKLLAKVAARTGGKGTP